MTKFTTLPQFKRGMIIEAFLDSLFNIYDFSIRRTTREEERDKCLGDRLLTRNGDSFYIEYKSGIQTHYTGNVFIETISVDDPKHYKQGWVYTSQAKYVIWAAILDNCLLFFKPEELRERIDELKKTYREVPTSHNQNDGYNTHGLLVPLEDAKKLAYKVVQIFP